MINLSIHHHCNLILSPQSTEYFFHLRVTIVYPFLSRRGVGRRGAERAMRTEPLVVLLMTARERPRSRSGVDCG
jgi:hypothetical protein